MDTKKYLVPRRLDDPPRFFFWDLDVALVFMTIMVFGILMESFFIAAIIATLLAGYFSRKKSGKQRGYGLHLMYWHLPLSMGFKRTPPSCVREFLG